VQNKIYNVVYKVQELEDAYNLKKEISRADQKEAGSERTMVGPLLCKKSPVFHE